MKNMFPKNRSLVIVSQTTMLVPAEVNTFQTTTITCCLSFAIVFDIFCKCFRYHQHCMTLQTQQR